MKISKVPRGKMIFFIFVFVLSAVFFGAVFGGYADAAPIKLNVNYPCIPAPVQGNCFDLDDIETGDLKPTIANIILFVYVASIWIGGLVAFISLIYTGFQFIISGDNPSVRAKTKERLQNVLWGILILLMAVLILRIINPALTNLNEPGLEPVNEGTTPRIGTPGRTAPRIFSCVWDPSFFNEHCKVGENECLDDSYGQAEYCSKFKNEVSCNTEGSEHVLCER